MFPHKHLDDSTVIFVTLIGRMCNLTALSWAYIYIIGICNYLFSCKYSLIHHPWNHGNGSLCTTNLQQLLLQLCKQNVWLPLNTRCILSALIHMPKWAMPFWEYIQSIRILPFCLKVEISSKYVKSLGIEKENQSMCPVAYGLFWLCMYYTAWKFIYLPI